MAFGAATDWGTSFEVAAGWIGWRLDVYKRQPIELEKWINVSLNLRQKDNVIEIEYDKKKMSSTFPLQETNSVTITFGQMLGYQAEVAPVNLRDINIIPVSYTHLRNMRFPISRLSTG